MTFRAERFHWGDDDKFDWHPAGDKAWHEKRDVDYIQDPTTGRFEGSRPGAHEEGIEFVSPNTATLGLNLAHQALGSERQGALKQASGEIDRTLGIQAED